MRAAALTAERDSRVHKRLPRCLSQGIVCRMSRHALPLVVLLAMPAFSASYRFGAVWDGESVQKNVCLTIRGEKIDGVGSCPADAVDMSRYTAIPGMIDVHTH